MPTLGVPLCCQCGTHNKMGCKVVGPTVGFVCFVVTAVFEWPIGIIVYPFKHRKGRRIMNHPSNVVFPKVSDAIPF
ncbi:uncharacterized protein LOC141612661 [Silene latifolia]|uniref:uncharacterized protein LOC141612661 n=1 Tax=Silene latifolia TaxID=37657 RepID=UPI003D76CE47